MLAEAMDEARPMPYVVQQQAEKIEELEKENVKLREMINRLKD
jgi:hypothetical protein